MTRLLFALLLFAGNASAYLDHHACTEGVSWAVNTPALEQTRRMEGALDSLGECAWTYYSAKNPQKQYRLITTYRAKSVSTVSGALQYVRGDGSCFVGSTGRDCSTGPTGGPPPGGLGASLTFADGTSLAFDCAQGVDQGDFVGEFVHEKNVLLTSGDWRVFCRSDVGTTRESVVVEYGRATGPRLGVINIMAPITFSVTKAGAAVYTARLPSVYYFSRFRWESSPLPVVRTAADLRSRGWIPHFDSSGLYGRTGIDYVMNVTGPMGRPVVTRYDQKPPKLDSNWSAVGTTTVYNSNPGQPGEREEIGPLPEPAAIWLMGLDSADNRAYNTVRAGADWYGNAQTHIRDNDGKMLNVSGLWQTSDYAGLHGTVNSTYADGSSFAGAATKVATDPRGDVTPGNPLSTNYIDIFTAGGEGHWPAWPNLLWLTTEDPYYLEEMQFSMNWRVLNNATGRSAEKLPLLARITQTRAVAWTLRDLFYLVRTTPSNVPGWLQPKSYWQAVLDDHHTLAMRFVNHPAKVFQTFRGWPIFTFNEPWMQNWLNGVIGTAVTQMGFTDWADVFDWSIQFEINHADPTRGWHREWAAPYMWSPLNLQTTDATKPCYYGGSFFTNPANYPSLVKASDYDPCTRASWADMWAAYATGDKYPGAIYQLSDKQPQPRQLGWHLDTTGWDGVTLLQDDYMSRTHSLPGTADALYYFTNIQHLQFAIAMGVARGTPGAKPIYDWLQTAIPKQYASYGPAHAKHVGRAAFSVGP